MIRGARRLCTLAAVLALALGLAACGDDDDKGTAASDTTQSTDQAAGDRSGQTIDVGLVNNEGGALSLPEFRIGAETAAKYVNDNGGIDGAKIKIHTCLAEPSPEGSVNCANEFVDAGVDVVYAAIDLAADASIPILSDAGIPLVSSNPWGTLMKSDPDTHILGTAAAAFYAGPFSYFAEQGSKRFVTINEDTPAGRQTIDDTVKPLAKALGIEATPVFVDPANPDWASAVTTAMDSKPDVIYGQLSEPACLGLVGAAKDLGYKGAVIAGSCTAFVQALGEKSVGAYALGDTWGPDAIDKAPADIKKDLNIYVKAMTDAGHKDQINGFAAITFAKFTDLTSILKTIPVDTVIDAKSIGAALGHAKGIKGFAAGPLDCSGTNDWPGETTACRSSLVIYKVEAGASGPVRTPIVDKMRDFSDVAKKLGA